MSSHFIAVLTSLYESCLNPCEERPYEMQANMKYKRSEQIKHFKSRIPFSCSSVANAAGVLPGCLLFAFLFLTEAGRTAVSTTAARCGFALWILACVLLSLLGASGLLRLPMQIRRGLYRLFLALSPFFLFLVVELPWNITIADFDIGYLPLNLILYALLELLFAQLFRNRAHGLYLIFTLGFVIGTANAFVLKFRGSPILAADITAASTAFAVAGQYKFVPDGRILSSALLLCTVFALLRTFSALGFSRTDGAAVLSIDRKSLHLHARLPRPTVSVLAAAAILLSAAQLNYAVLFGIPVNMYVPVITYRIAGFTPSIITFFQKMRVAAPEGYSDDAANAILAQYQQEPQEADNTAAPAPVNGAAAAKAAAGQKPAIIAIMNESFSDLSVVGPFDAAKEHLSYLHSLAENPGTVELGRNYVSTYGGGTSTTEFEFLTGNSMSALQGTNPYGAFNFSGDPSIVKVLKDSGYEAIAMHPENPFNWRRSTVYPALGFDEFLSADDFSGYERTVRNRISDAGDYQKLIDVYESKKGSGKPLFLFNVTMQNHGEYDLSLISSGERVEIDSRYASYQDVAAYSALLNKADKAIHVLIDYFSQEDEPVLLCFFGDHQPNLDDKFEQQLSDSGKQDGEPQLVTEERKRITPYFIWSNYGVRPQNVKTDAAGNEIMSTNYLGISVQRYAGLPLSPYGNFLLNQRDDIPVINILGYYGSDGLWHPFDQTKKAAPKQAKAEENVPALTEMQKSAAASPEAKGAASPEAKGAASPETKSAARVPASEEAKTGFKSESDSKPASGVETYENWIKRYRIVEYNALFDKKRDEVYYTLSSGLRSK